MIPCFKMACLKASLGSVGTTGLLAVLLDTRMCYRFRLVGGAIWEISAGSCGPSHLPWC